MTITIEKIYLYQSKPIMSVFSIKIMRIFLFIFSSIFILSSCGYYKTITFENAEYRRGDKTRIIHKYVNSGSNSVHKTTFFLHTNDTVFQLTNVSIKPGNLSKTLTGQIIAERTELDTMYNFVYQFMQPETKGQIKDKRMRPFINQTHIYASELNENDEKIIINDNSIVDFEIFSQNKSKTRAFWMPLLLIPLAGLVIIAVAINPLG